MSYDDPDQRWHWDPNTVMDHVLNVALHLDDRVADLEWLWSDVRNNIIDVVARTIALCLFTSIAAGVIYTIISKRWRDWMVVFILFAILPDVLTALSLWLGFTSRLAQQYSLMRVKLADINTSVDNIKVCVDSLTCDDPYALADRKPLYTSHGCVGTALLATDPLLHSVVIVGLTVNWLFQKGRLGWLNGGILFAPLLAAAVSAAKHVQGVCWPDPIAIGHIRVVAKWEVFSPKYPDVTSARLSLLSRVGPLFVILFYVWQEREAYKAFFRDGSIRGQWTRWLAITYLLPVAIDGGWRSLRAAYDNGQRKTTWPIFEFAFFSFGDALLVPLMAMYPGIAIFFQRLWYVDTERESEPEAAVGSTNEKADTTLSPSASSTPAVADSKSGEAAPSAAL